MGDALGEDATVEGGFAGLTVDLFAEGKVLADLHQVGPLLDSSIHRF